MSYEREEREERGRGERGRKPQKPIRYTYRYQKSPKTPKTPEVHGVTAPKLGKIISTKAGPAKVLEVFWRSATDADVLLQHIEAKTVPEKLAAADAVKKPQRPKQQRRGSRDRLF